MKQLTICVHIFSQIVIRLSVARLISNGWMEKMCSSSKGLYHHARRTRTIFSPQNVTHRNDGAQTLSRVEMWRNADKNLISCKVRNSYSKFTLHKRAILIKKITWPCASTPDVTIKSIGQFLIVTELIRCGSTIFRGNRYAPSFSFTLM